MADEELDLEQVAALRKKRQFKKLTFRGLELEQLLDLNQTELLNFVNARARRRMKRATSSGPKYMSLIKKIKAAKAKCGPLDRPDPIKTHLRNALIVPEMIGGQVAVYNGKVFNIVMITGEMVGMYLGEFSITYRPVRHGRPGMGSTNSSRFIPLK
jgi:small subunit ribosomal protein S15e